MHEFNFFDPFLICPFFTFERFQFPQEQLYWEVKIGKGLCGFFWISSWCGGIFDSAAKMFSAPRNQVFPDALNVSSK
jgi:hypothetical protein